MRLDELWGHPGRRQQQQQQQQPEPQMVQTLVDMGFSQTRAVEALQQTGGDLDQATNLLIQQIM
jgi:uncharacterized UBP type Zn finger protein